MSLQINFDLNPKLFHESIIAKLNHITNHVLKSNDTEIYNHLANGITLHPFGMCVLHILTCI